MNNSRPNLGLISPTYRRTLDINIPSDDVISVNGYKGPDLDLYIDKFGELLRRAEQLNIHSNEIQESHDERCAWRSHEAQLRGSESALSDS